MKGVIKGLRPPPKENFTALGRDNEKLHNLFRKVVELSTESLARHKKISHESFFSGKLFGRQSKVNDRSINKTKFIGVTGIYL
jgi:hypothetical protein